jgi:hypothetical protein
MIQIDIMFDSKCVEIIRIPNVSTLIASKCMIVNYDILAPGIGGQPEVN